MYKEKQRTKGVRLKKKRKESQNSVESITPRKNE